MKREKGLGRFSGLIILITTGMISCGGYTQVESNIASEGTGGTDVSYTSGAPADLGVGDMMMVDFSGIVSASIDFEGVDDDAKFVLALGSASTAGNGTQMKLTGDVVLPNVAAMSLDASSEMLSGDMEDEAYGAQEVLSSWLRAAEQVLHEQEVVAEPESASFSPSLAAKAMSLESTESFQVLSSLSSTSSSVQVVGQVRCIRDNVVIYVDVDVVDDGTLFQEDIDELCEDFDREVAEMSDLLGDPSDVDGDGKVHVLMTKQVNRLGALGGGIVTGYFFAADLYEQSDSNPVTNHREVIYTLVPDPDGSYGIPVERDFAMENLLPAVLPHELQHAISYNQHVFVKGGGPEENWLNEAMSHFIEDWVGHNRENYSRFDLFLRSPSTYGIVTQASPNLMERGGSYLFLRYLYEQAIDGDAFIGALSQTSKHGVENLEAAFDGPGDMDEFQEFMVRWVATLAYSDVGISQDSRYRYASRAVHPDTGEMHGVVLKGSVEDGRGTVLEGVNMTTFSGPQQASIDGSTARFYRITDVPSSIVIDASSQGENFGMLIRYE